MDDRVRLHPTRAEQLDIMASAICDLARPGAHLHGNVAMMAATWPG
jgi:hypothetical protein